MKKIRFERRIRSAQRRYCEARLFAMAMRSAQHPVLAHIVPIRRCNLSCAYCNEFDNQSAPVPLKEMVARIDRLASLGTTMITISGGEPLLHPALDQIIGHIRSRHILTTLITNGLLITPGLIDDLNTSGLDHIQISIDNLSPDVISKKSLKALDGKLRLLSERALFEVDVNSVIGASVGDPEDAYTIALRARQLGFSVTVGLVHNGQGQLLPLSEEHRAVLRKIQMLQRSTFSAARWNPFQANLALGLANNWHCPAGGRYLYVCEEGLVHWCSQQRGRPGIPLAEYTPEVLEHEGKTLKSCAAYCTIGCVHRIAMLDELRKNPRAAVNRWLAVEYTQGNSVPIPWPVRGLLWIFEGPMGSVRRLMSGAALRLLGLH